MAVTNSLRKSLAFLLCILLLFVLDSSSITYAEEHSLVVSQSTAFQPSRGLPVRNSPGSKPGSTVLCERVHIHGLSKIRNLLKFAHTLKVKVSVSNSTAPPSNVAVCFHRNMSLGLGMCPQSQWEKVLKGNWSHSMSPFDHKLLDVRTSGSSLEIFEVSIEEEFYVYRIAFLVLGVVLMSLASSLSKSLVFYYSSAMAVGVLLVILMVLFQGMKLLPTGRKNSLAIFIYSSVVGLGSFLLRYIPGLVHTILMEMGVSEDMYNPLAVFFVAFIVLAGAWLGFWVVRKVVLTEDGSIDISTALFVAWSIRVVASLLIIQSSVDPVLALGALLSGIIVSSILRRICRLRFLRRHYKNLFKSPKKTRKVSHTSELPPLEDSYDEYEDSRIHRPRFQDFALLPCNSPKQELLFPSSFHNTPERRKFSKNEWERFTKNSTNKALEGLISSPDFSKWVLDNSERITITPNSTRSQQERPKRFYWF